jgi:hypothetical protein
MRVIGGKSEKFGEYLLRRLFVQRQSSGNELESAR